jgi:hypothetical protein
MTLRTRQGAERIVAFTRFIHAPRSPNDATDTGLKTLVCVGVDLTDRLLDADKQGLPEAALDAAAFIPFGPQPGNGGAVDADIVQPLAISPPAPQAGMEAQEAIRQVHSFLTEIHLRMTALESAHARGELGDLARLARHLSAGAYACGLLEFSARAERLQHAANSAEIGAVNTLVRDILAMYQPSIEQR